ncbi:hypothetical protein E4U14_003692 [Claviceps sp. LM454 group G7]|nr:hypothetical protein E4U14_003692 [Claviceps sp. LM454 group G7]
MGSTVFNVGIIGYGLSAKIFHIPFIATTPQFKLHSIVQRSPREGNSAPHDHPDIKHHTEVATLLADPDLHVVVISTPPDTHFQLIKAALEAGKHVLAEKPLVPTSAEADTLTALAREKKRLLCVYQNRRWDSDFLLVRHLLSEDQLGRVLEFNTHMDRYRAEAPTNWKSTVGIPDGGSALFDLGTHLIDQVYLLFGMPQAVQGRLLSQREGRMDFHNPDAVFAQLTYPGGMLVHVRISALSTETNQPRFWVRGSKGSFHKFGPDPQEDQLKDGMSPLDERFGRDSSDSMRLVLVGNTEAAGQQQAKSQMREVAVPDLQPQTYTAFYAAWGKAVESGNEEDVPVKPSQARDVLRLIEAVVESAKSGKDVAIA